jgi:hypothetical protein
MAPTYVLAYNTGDSPIVVDSSGRTIGGHEWAPARRGAVLDAAGNNGSIVVLTKIEEEHAGDEALAAWHQVAAWNEAAEKWAGIPADTVREHARAQAASIGLGELDKDQLDDTVDGVDVAHLVDSLVRADVAAPATRKRPAAAQTEE